MQVKSCINRMGGKKLLAGWLSEKIPKHTCYVEPFCGGANLLFSKTPSQVEVINDIDNHLINFFRVVREPEKCKMLIERLRYMPYSRNLWQEIRTNWKQGNIPGDSVESSAQWYYLNRSCFGGDQNRGGFAVPSTTGRNPAQSFRNAIDAFKDIAERLRNVTIENLPYAECIKRYDSEDTLFYCDPPYLDAEHYYGNTFSQDNHYRLAELLNKAKGKVMITHYQNGLYDELYRGWNQHEYSSFKGSHKSDNGESKPKTIECLWMNFKPEIEGERDQ